MATINRQSEPGTQNLKLLHSIITADETVPADAHFMLSPARLFSSNIVHEFTEVAHYDRIRMYFVGTDAANETVTINFYGMYKFGGLKLIGTSTNAVLGATSVLAADNANGPGFLQGNIGVEDAVDEEFNRKQVGNSFLAVDSYATVSNDEAPATLIDYLHGVDSTADQLGHIDLDLSYTRYDYLLVSIALGTAASCGGVFYPLRFRNERLGSDRASRGQA